MIAASEPGKGADNESYMCSRVVWSFPTTQTIALTSDGGLKIVRPSLLSSGIYFCQLKVNRRCLCVYEREREREREKVYVYVCVCVCVCKRDGEGDNGLLLLSFWVGELVIENITMRERKGKERLKGVRIKSEG